MEYISLSASSRFNKRAKLCNVNYVVTVYIETKLVRKKDHMCVRVCVCAHMCAFIFLICKKTKIAYALAIGWGIYASLSASSCTIIRAKLSNVNYAIILYIETMLVRKKKVFLHIFWNNISIKS